MAINTSIGKTTDPITGSSKGIDVADLTNGALDNNAGVDTSATAKSGSGATGVASAGMDVLTSLPGLIANAKLKPEEMGQSREEVREIVKAQNMNYITTGMEIGGSIGSIWGPIGGLIGTAVGGLGGVIAGDTQKGKAINKFNEEQNIEENAEWTQNEQKRLQDYFDNTSSQRMQAEMNLMKQQQGFIT